MAVGKGKFLLYSKIDPPLTAGTYKFTAEQVLSSATLDSDDLKVEKLETHVRVRSPLYVLPPDQVLSTFPPAGREGSFGARLPQIVIKRRTLPWERDVDPIDMTQVDPDAKLDAVPWLALVLIAEGEAELKSNQPVAECVTPGVTIEGLADSQTGNCLHIRKSMVDRIFPTQQEVHLLAHAREVDITDTELMMGDDDGFLSVVISNRLPLPGRGEDDEDVPVKYLACLVNLCGQFHKLPPKAPTPPSDILVTKFPRVEVATEISVATKDKIVMGTLQPEAFDVIPKADVFDTVIQRNVVNPQAKAAYEAQTGWGVDRATRGTTDLYVEMARDFDRGVIGIEPGRLIDAIDPTLRFPVLIHWSFTSCGDETFESLMEALDSGLIGTQGTPDPDDQTKTPKPPVGRLPLEVVETGHVGLPHRLRRGDQVRSWYRGPLLPHPADETLARLPLAHAADQVRVIVPDGREDVSLAAAFEIGRLLGLSRPSMVASLMRWRQLGFQQARLRGIITSGILQDLQDALGDLDRFVGGRAGAAIIEELIASPEEILGNPSPLVRAGLPVLEDGSANAVLAQGLGLPHDAFAGDPGLVLQQLRGSEVALPPADLMADTGILKETLFPTLDSRFSRASLAALAPSLTEDVLADGVSGIPLDLGLAFSGVDLDPALVGGLTDVARFQPHGKGVDALDELLEAKRARSAESDEEETPWA